MRDESIPVLIHHSAFIFHLFLYAGVIYLFYIGAKGLISSFKHSSDVEYSAASEMITSSTALKQGFLTNLLNPKAAMFFISLFSQFIDPSTPIILRFEYVAVNWIVAIGWFFFLAYLVTAKSLMNKVTNSEDM